MAARRGPMQPARKVTPARAAGRRCAAPRPACTTRRPPPPGTRARRRRADRTRAPGAAPSPAGKTTLLQLLAGKYMVGRSVITVLGRSPFYDLVRRRYATSSKMGS